MAHRTARGHCHGRRRGRDSIDVIAPVATTEAAIPLGHAVVTGAGRLPFKHIIHVAGINMLWRASERSIRDSVANAIRPGARVRRPLARDATHRSGSRGFDEVRVLALIIDAVDSEPNDVDVTVVRFIR